MEGSQPGADNENGEGSTNDIPDAQTSGYTPWGRLNSAMGRSNDGSPGGSFQISPHASRITNPNVEFLDNSGGRRAGNQPQELFGDDTQLTSSTSVPFVVETGLRWPKFEAYDSICVNALDLSVSFDELGLPLLVLVTRHVYRVSTRDVFLIRHGVGTNLARILVVLLHVLKHALKVADDKVRCFDGVLDVFERD